MNWIAMMLGAGLALVSTASLAEDCAASDFIGKLRAAELEWQLQKFPPAFRHAQEDGGVALRVTKSAAASGECRFLLEETLPEADVKQAAEIIDRQPARRIMLMSQGYDVPQESQLRAEFTLDPATAAVAHADTLQVAELGKLRATVEMVYATLSQARAEVTDASTNAQPWPELLRTQAMAACKSRDKGASADERCGCRIDKLQQKVDARQMENIAYVKENPYAYATGVLKSYEALEADIARTCR